MQIVKFNEGYVSQRGPTLFKNLRELHCEIGFNDLCTVVSNLGGLPSLEKLCIHVPLNMQVMEWMSCQSILCLTLREFARMMFYWGF
ncbi:hypothetical protein QJS10_CPA02g00410 [Acorus calamus]|uniref:Uncharacterized protein n=1 Tax=Acorus calamus TaxID=4465 RepID=A0AAV9FGT1_ACOCL|nr:hypothetical protein QJS10_CPA02g00410 [Acorus calamus]